MYASIRETSDLTTLDLYQRGYHNIENELVFGSNPDFAFHDSCGFEAGGEEEFKNMKKFVLERASTMKLKERIHVIWQAIISVRLYLFIMFYYRYCIPMDECHRAITKAEEKFFSECNTNSGIFMIVTSLIDSVPVIVVFTKFDALWD